VIFFFCNLARLFKLMFQMMDEKSARLSVILVTDEVLQGIQGAIICLVFFWKNRKIEYSSFLESECHFSEPSITDLENLGR